MSAQIKENCRRIIQAVLDENQDLIKSIPFSTRAATALRSRLKASCPYLPEILSNRRYGRRNSRQSPYIKKGLRIWRNEVAVRMASLATGIDTAIFRTCPACGQRYGMWCRGIGPGDMVWEHEQIIRDAEMDGNEDAVEALQKAMPIHASRVPPPPNLELPFRK